LEHLRAIPPFFAASSEVTRQEFSTFVSPALQRHRGIYTFEFLPRVPADRVDVFERAAQAAGFDNFVIRTVDVDGNDVPLKMQDAYFPIYFGEPAIQRVVGIDLRSHPEQGRYIERACSAMGPVATHPLSLIEDADDILSVIAFIAVRFEPTRRDEECDGIAMLILRIRPVVEEAVGATRLADFAISLRDPDASGSRQLVHRNYLAEDGNARDKKGLAAKHEIRFADQTWHLSVAPAAGSTFAPGNAPYWILATGLILSLLAAYSVSAK
ncbi:unnamed protein product, partial [marine sediment metagenome]